jgi:hypothetical protein
MKRANFHSCSLLTLSPQTPLMEQILLFGDSITEFAEGPDGFASVMRNGTLLSLSQKTLHSRTSARLLPHLHAYAMGSFPANAALPSPVRRSSLHDPVTNFPFSNSLLLC